MTTRWVGVDPGSRWTGIVARDNKHVLTAAIIDRDDDTTTYAHRVIEATIAAARTTNPPLGDGANIAIEDINDPTPHLGMTGVADLIGLARLIGYLEHALPTAVIVPPHKHGHRPWATYPAELTTPGERRTINRLKTAGQHTVMRHARSAWDVAGTAMQNPRLRKGVPA